MGDSGPERPRDIAAHASSIRWCRPSNLRLEASRDRAGVVAQPRRAPTAWLPHAHRASHRIRRWHRRGASCVCLRKRSARTPPCIQLGSSGTSIRGIRATRESGGSVIGRPANPVGGRRRFCGPNTKDGNTAAATPPSTQAVARSKSISDCAQPLTADQIDTQTAKHSYRAFDIEKDADCDGAVTVD